MHSTSGQSWFSSPPCSQSGVVPPQSTRYPDAPPSPTNFYFAIPGRAFPLLAVQADFLGKRAAYLKTGTVAAMATVLLGWLLLFPLQPRHPPNPLVRWSYDLLQLVLPEH